MDDPIRVLHVDDEPDFAELAATYLEREDDRFVVRTATSATEGLDVIGEGEVDCVVSDYEMPDTDGIEFLRTVREDHPDLPFVLFTGRGSEEVASEAISAGVTDYLQKEQGTEQYAVLANRVVNAVERTRAEQQLSRTNTLLSTLFDALPVGVLVEDEDREVLAVNERHLELFGIEAVPEEVVGRDAQAIVDEVSEMFADPEEFVARTNDLVDERGAVEREELELADGRTFLRTHCPVGLPDGVGYIWLYQDLTDRKERERTLERREQTLYRTYEVVADDERSVEEKIEALLSVGRSMIGTDYATFSHVHGDTYEFEAVDVAPGIDLAGGTTTVLEELPVCERVVESERTVVLRDVEGEAPALADRRWEVSCYLGAPVVVDGEVYGTFCFYDTEARAEAFSDWERTYVELLGDWVGTALTQQRAREELERQNERLDEFASMVSHDLRNPLGVAEGRLDIAREEPTSDALDAVEDAHDRMGELIDDLLAWARTGEAVAETEPVDVGAVARDCWGTIDAGEASLDVETDRAVAADPDRFRQLLANLLQNAVDHGGSVVTVGEHDDGLYVADDGPGVPEDEREAVFDGGYTTSDDGTGFGLAIVEEVAEAHGWEVGVTESAEGGARFEVSGVEWG